MSREWSVAVAEDPATIMALPTGACRARSMEKQLCELRIEIPGLLWLSGAASLGVRSSLR
jgi:hypothetical protein